MTELSANIARPAERSRFLLLLGLFVGTLLGIFFQPAVAEANAEYKLKAAVLYKLLKFVEWPNEQEEGASKQTVLNICVVGGNPFQDALDSVAGNKVRDMTIGVRKITEPQSSEIPSTCRMVFLNVARGTHESALLEELTNRHVLTVGDKQGFARRGGGIELILQDGKIRFIINQRTVKQSGLHVAAPLLSFAELIAP